MVCAFFYYLFIKMRTFNLLQKFFFLFLMGFTLCTIQACDDEDDDEGGSGSGVKQCYVKIDDKQTDFKYAYYCDYGDGDIELEFTTIDMLYYIKNPQKITQGTLFTDAYFYFENEIPTGTTKNYEFCLDMNVDLYYTISEGDREDEIISYETIYGKEQTPINIARDGNNYKIDANSMKIRGGHIDEQKIETTATFFFEGSATNVSQYGQMEASENRGITFVKVDKPLMNQIKSMCNK